MKILHLEMSQFFSRVIEKVALSYGHDYRNEKGIEAGLAALEEWEYDLVITSHILQDGRAEALLENLVGTKHKDIPVIVITADDSMTTREHFFSLGVMDYLQKSDLIPQKLTLYFDIIAMGGEILEELKSLRVAVLDDSNVSLRVIRRIFNYYDIGHAEYFSSPKELLAADLFDLYIIDMVMPEMTGEEVLLEIKSRNTHCGVIIVSGISNKLAMSHALSLGADDYIAKPFDSRDFIARVKSVVRQLLLLRELEEKSQQMEEASKRDSLTGLWNHGAIHDILVHEMNNAGDRAVSVALFDLDNFKVVNDHHGHQVGDDVLLAVSDVFSSRCMGKGEVGRYGGEEFLLVMPGLNSREAKLIAEHILGHFRKMDMGIAELSITCSCGVSDSSENSDAMKMVELADNRLYQAKDAGKDRVVN